ncbi:conserved hypothetical protein [Rubrivivax sp. A210]|nr:conserved hypothetical protein [Rubrivivax sp. A210]
MTTSPPGRGAASAAAGNMQGWRPKIAPAAFSPTDESHEQRDRPFQHDRAADPPLGCARCRRAVAAVHRAPRGFRAARPARAGLRRHPGAADRRPARRAGHARAQGRGPAAAGTAGAAPREGARDRLRLGLHGRAAGPPRPAGLHAGMPARTGPHGARQPAPQRHPQRHRGRSLGRRRHAGPAGRGALRRHPALGLGPRGAARTAAAAQAGRPPGRRRGRGARDARTPVHPHGRSLMVRGRPLRHRGAAARRLCRADALPLLNRRMANAVHRPERATDRSPCAGRRKAAAASAWQR